MSVLEFIESELEVLHTIPQQVVSNCFDEVFSNFDNLNLVFNFTFFDDSQSYGKLYKLGNTLCDKMLISSNIKSLTNDEILLNKNLCILLWYGIEVALKNFKLLKSLVDGLHSVRCYFLLASTEGAIESDIYHDNIVKKSFDLYLKVLKIIKEKKFILDKKSGKSRKSLMAVNDFSQIEISLSDDEVEELEKELYKTLDGLFVILKKLISNISTENLQTLCNIIKYLFRIELSKKTCIYKCNSIKDFKKLTTLSDIGFFLLHILCDSDHEVLKELYTLVVMPRIMYATIDNDQFLPSTCHINMEMTNTCEIFLNFLKERIKINIREHEIIYCMLVSACLKCPERAEYRTKILKAVIDVINVMTLNYKNQFIENILVIGENTRGALRAFAIEAIPLLLKTFDFINFNSQTTMNNSIFCSPGVTIKKEIESQNSEFISQELSTENLEIKFLKLVIYGIEDKVGSVRQRALSVLPTFLKNETLRNQCNKELVKLFKELRRFDLTKNQRKRKNNESIDETERIKIPRYSIENNNDDIIEEMDCSDVASESSQKDINDNIPTTQNNINSLGIDMNSTQINVQIISDEGGIFERKRVFKVNDYLLLNRLLVKCDDTVAGCKKNAIVALENLFPYLTKEEHVDAVINQFCRSARDKSVLIRKQISESVCNILFNLNENHIFYKKVVVASIECILLQVVDRERSVQLNAAKLVYQTLFLPLIDGDTTHKIAWNILAFCEEVINYQKILKEVVSILVREKMIDNDLVYSLDRIMGNVDDKISCRCIWMLYSILSIFMYVNPINASEEFLRVGKEYLRDDFKLINYLTTIISHGTIHLPGETKELLIQHIEKYIKSFNINSNNISSVYYCYHVLIKGVDDDDETGKILFAQKNETIFKIALENMKLLMFEEYNGDVVNLDSSIFDYPSNESQNGGDDVKLARILCTIGEIVDYENSFICKDLFEMLQLIMSSKICKKALRIYQEQTLSGTILSLNSCQNTQNSQLSSYRRGESLSLMKYFKSHHIKFINISPIVQAQCVLIMGKICLVDEMLARDVIPVFMKELVISKDYIIKNNIIVVVHDLCKHHTSFVGSYLDIFGACLNDDSVAVRIHTLHCLTRLLKEGYLIWKGDIVFRFVSTLLDQVSRVREYAEFCLVETLLPIKMDLFYVNFIECLFYFNGVEHPSWIYYNQAKGNKDGGKFNKHRSLKGSHFEKDRQTLYCFMLRNMTNIQKMSMTKKICIEIIERIYNKSLDFYDINVQNMLVDSFKLLSSEEGKVRFNMEKSGEEEDDDDNERREMERMVVCKIAEKASKEMLKEVFIKEIMKYLLELRDFLYATKNSRCAFEFLKYLLFLSNEHNHEFDKILKENRHLTAGVSYDILRLKNKLNQDSII